jgi:hypothetical protein
MKKRNNILPYIYASRSVPEFLNNYSYDLLMAGESEKKLEAAKLMEYERTITDIDYLVMLRDAFNELYEILDRRFPELLFLLEGRRKSLISVIGKIHLLLHQNSLLPKDLQLEDPLKRIKDFMAFRIILLDKDPEELIPMLYKIADVIIEFFQIKGFEAVLAEPPKGIGKFDNSLHPDVFVPEKSLISKQNEKFVKDYVIFPKENGYQSLHIVFYDPITKRNFEVQMRTFSMHVSAESGEADHMIYKANNYESVDVDYSKINIRGFEKISNSAQIRINNIIENLTEFVKKCESDERLEMLQALEELEQLTLEFNRGYIDDAGVFDSITILKRQKTFSHIRV